MNRFLIFIKEKSLAQISQLSREFILITIGQVATVTGMMAGVKVLTKALPPESYGRFALGLSVAAIANALLLTPISSAATRFFAAASDKHELKSYFRAVTTLTAKASLITVAMAFIVFLSAAYMAPDSWSALIVSATFYSVVLGTSSVLSGIQTAARQRALVAIHTGLSSWGKFCLAKFFVVYFGSTGTVALWAYGLVGLITNLSQYVFFRKALQGTILKDDTNNNPKKWEKRLFSYGWPFATWGLLEAANLSSGRWALQFFSSTHDVGYFAVLYQLGFYPLNVLCGLIAQLIAPILFKIAGSAENEAKLIKVNTLAMYLTLGGVGLTLFIAFLAYIASNQVFIWLVDPAYASVSYLLPWMTIGGGFFAVAQIAALGPLCQSSSHSMMKPKIASSIIGIVASMVGGYYYGIEGVVGASIISSTIYLFWMLLILIKIIKPSEMPGKHHDNRS